MTTPTPEQEQRRWRVLDDKGQVISEGAAKIIREGPGAPFAVFDPPADVSDEGSRFEWIDPWD